MKTLIFLHNHHNKGLNLTVRKGVLWSFESEAYIPYVGLKQIKTRIMRFKDLKDDDLKLEHDFSCRTCDGLFSVLSEIYPGFDCRELITLVYYNV